MFRLRRWYNQNSKTIWKVTGIVVFLIIILQLFDFFAANKNKNKNKNNYNNTNVNISVKNEYTDLSLESDKSVLSNNKISSFQNDSIKTINTFFSFCNSGNIKKAYELLTDECKEKMCPKLENFKNNYYRVLFNGKKKTISLENWNGNIYRVKITEDLLSSGFYDENSTRQDYITVQKIDKAYKLNINGYIETKEINKNNNFYDIFEMTVEKKDVYMDYEVYTLKVKNKMENPLLLDDLKEIDSMYLVDKNNLKYSAYTHEISMAELLINANETRTIKIKYYNRYGSEKRIKNIGFSRVVIDYYSYQNTLKSNRIFNRYNEFKIEL